MQNLGRILDSKSTFTFQRNEISNLELRNNNRKFENFDKKIQMDKTVAMLTLKSLGKRRPNQKLPMAIKVILTDNLNK